MLSRHVQLGLVCVVGWAGALIGGLSGPAIWGADVTMSACLLTIFAGMMLALNAVNHFPSVERFSPLLTTIAALVPAALLALPITFILKTLSSANGIEFLYTWQGALAGAFLLLVSGKGVAWSLTTRWNSDESKVVEIVSLVMVVIAVLPNWDAPTEVETVVAQSQASEDRR